MIKDCDKDSVRLENVHITHKDAGKSNKIENLF